jgi:hypothetical protein
MAAVAGLRGTGDWGTDERPKNFREMILFLNANGDTPLTALMSRVSKRTTDDPEFTWWDEPVTIARLQVAGALAAGDTTVVVDSVDPTASTLDASWGVASHLKPGDLLMVEEDTDPFTPEYISVVSVINDTTFTVKRGQAGGAAAGVIADDAFLLLIGSQYAEGTPSPKATSRNPVKYTNYTQIFKDTYELTGTAEQTRARTGPALQNDKKRKMWDHARALEFAFMFGSQSEGTGDNGKPLRTTQGLRKYIPGANTTVFGAAVTISSFLDAVAPVFDWNSPAGDERVVLCGNTALNELNKVIQGDSNVQIQYGGQIKVFGMNMREFILPQGRLLFRTHPLLNRHAVYKSSMWITDFSSLRWVPMRNRDTRFKDNIQNNDEDTRKGEWRTEAGLQVDFGGLTNGYLGNVSAT